MTWAELVTKLIHREDLSGDEARWAMDVIMAGEASPARLAAFLVALRAKGETVEEVNALADGMLAAARPIDIAGPTLDIVGTGGDMAHTVNISTMAALVCAGAGAKIAKHGNRASSSSTGTADVLEELGVDLSLEPETLARMSGQAPVTFLFAQVFHPSMRFAAPTRRELGVPTVFNFLGPLTNPARPAVAAIGCADATMAPVMAGVYAHRGMDAAVFRGDDGLDELTLTTSSQVWWVFGGEVTQVRVQPEDFGLTSAPIESLRGGDAAFNAQVVRDVLGGAEGAPRDAVVLNAGLALALWAQHESGVLFGGAADVTTAIAAGVKRARTAIDSGAAMHALTTWIELTRVKGEAK